MDTLNLGRALVAVCFVATAFILQTTVLARIGLPGATPDLLLIVVLVLALSAGPLVATVIGFSAGLLVDLAPPASGSLGQTAAIYALAGFVAAHISFAAPGKIDPMTILSIAGLGSAVVLVQLVVGSLLGTITVTWLAVPVLAITQFVYCAILAVVLIPPVALLYRGAGDEGRYA
jgi:rod shape-determining protein MreD